MQYEELVENADTQGKANTALQPLPQSMEIERRIPRFHATVAVPAHQFPAEAKSKSHKPKL